MFDENRTYIHTYIHTYMCTVCPQIQISHVMTVKSDWLVGKQTMRGGWRSVSITSLAPFVMTSGITEMQPLSATKQALAEKVLIW